MRNSSKNARGDAIGFFDALVRCETRLYNALNDRLRESHGIVTSQFESLRFLRDRPGARVADLAAYFAIGIGATSKAVDRLEARGLARRVPNPDDRRSSLVALTAAGTRLANEAEVTFSRHLRELVGRALPSARLRAAHEALTDLRAVLESDEIGTPIG